MATSNQLPNFNCNCSITVTGYCYFKCNDVVLFTKKLTGYVAEVLLRYIYHRHVRFRVIRIYMICNFFFDPRHFSTKKGTFGEDNILAFMLLYVHRL
jgi:hypothetical protein